MVLITDLSSFVCRSTTPIEGVLRRLDASPHLFQIVLDRENRLLGTVTDGDIRRAMLQGIGLDEPAERCMQTKPTTGLVGDQQNNEAKLQRLGSSRPSGILSPNKITQIRLVKGRGRRPNINRQ